MNLFCSYVYRSVNYNGSLAKLSGAHSLHRFVYRTVNYYGSQAKSTWTSLGVFHFERDTL